MTVIGDRRRPGRWAPRVVCAKCGAAYDATADEEIGTLRADVQTTPRAGRHDLDLAEFLDEWRKLRHVVYRRPRSFSLYRWEFTLEAWRLWLHAGVGGYRAVAAYGLAATLDWPELWTEDIVRATIAKARRIVFDRARKRPRPLIVADFTSSDRSE